MPRTGLEDVKHPVVKAMISYRFVCGFFSFLCFLLLLVAHCSHSWRTYEPITGLYTMGLWTICSEKTGCRKLAGGHVNMQFTRAFMMLALIASFMAVIWAIEWDHLCHCNFTFLPKALITSICNFLAGICLLIGLVMFEIESTRVPEKSSFKNWAFYLSCVVGALCLFTAILNLVAYKFSLWGTAQSHCQIVGPEHEEATETPTVAPALL